MKQLLAEGDYCPECGMRQAIGFTSHMPKCSFKSKKEKYLSREFQGYKEGSFTHLVLQKFVREKELTTRELKLMFPTTGEAQIHNTIQILKRKEFIEKTLDEKWRLIDDSCNNLQV